MAMKMPTMATGITEVKNATTLANKGRSERKRDEKQRRAMKDAHPVGRFSSQVATDWPPGPSWLKSAASDGTLATDVIAAIGINLRVAL